jgi:hypothetical protein
VASLDLSPLIAQKLATRDPAVAATPTTEATALPVAEPASSAAPATASAM